MRNARIQNVMRALGETREAVADVAGIVADFVTHPSQWRPKMQEWAEKRQDGAMKTRLNRQIRSQFMQAFNLSASKKLSLEVNEDMDRYRSRNKTMSLLLRPYEAFSYFNLPLKLVTAFAFFKGLRDLLAPVMGPWAMIVPLTAFVGGRMGVAYRDAENKRQEEKFSANGLVVPCDFAVAKSTPSVMGFAVADRQPIAFPLMHQNAPEWLLSRYDETNKKLTKPETVHAAVYEAALSDMGFEADQVKINEAFPQQKSLQDFTAMMTIIFKDQSVEALILQTQELAKETVKVPVEAKKDTALSAAFAAVNPAKREATFPEAAMKVLEPFCLRGNDGAGLSALAGRVGEGDIRFIVELQSLGHRADAAQATEALRMLEDPRLENLSFRQVMEAAMLPKAQAADLAEMLKDREYRTRFGFDMLRDMVIYAEGWGGVALKLSRHEYTKLLSDDDLRELAQPENEYWAKTYHQMRMSMKGQTQNVAHADLKKMVMELGLTASDALSRMNAGIAANTNHAIAETRRACGLAT